MSELLKGSLGFKGTKGDTGEIGTPVPYKGTFEQLKKSDMDKFHNYIILGNLDTKYEGHWVYYDRYTSEWKDGGPYLSHYVNEEIEEKFKKMEEDINDNDVAQKLLEQKYNEQIKNLANSEPQSPEIVDARGGFDSLGSVIKQKVFHFNNIEEMKKCPTLIER